MKKYIGIDLGTTNSAICMYDGERVEIVKSKCEHDVTPSAIYFAKRGNKYIGRDAYEKIPADKENVATGFKRFMGSSTPIHIANLDQPLTPEECSAMILKELFGLLPDDVSSDPEVGTVITVPAAFNQMQKDATLQAANMAGIGKIVLMQEPVAAIMAVMKARPDSDTFLIYDIGGGTTDISIAEAINGHVNLHGQGGIAMLGGRDFDNILVSEVIHPWLEDNFSLPDDFPFDKFKTLFAFASEKAKIELSSKDESVISLDEKDIGLQDEDGEDIYLDIPITRKEFDKLIKDKIDDSIKATKKTISDAGYSTDDISRIIFVGGPSKYQPLRDKVSKALGIPANTDVNPMTAVAEGAAIYAESYDFKSGDKKSIRGSVKTQGPVNVSFDFLKRTPDTKTKLKVSYPDNIKGSFEIQIDAVDSTWSSGKIALKKDLLIDLTLSKSGENIFKIFLFNEYGETIPIKPNTITVTRTAASIDSIPASHSIGLAVREKIGGKSVIMDCIVKKGDALPKKGKTKVKTIEQLKAGDIGSIVFQLYEGELKDPNENQFIGVFKIRGGDFEDGVIPSGGEIDITYEMSDAGNINLEFTVPSISFVASHNFYSRQEGQKDYTDDDVKKEIISDVEDVKEKADEIANQIDDTELNEIREKLDRASELSEDESDPEKVKETEEITLQAKRDLYEIRKKHLSKMRQIELDNVVKRFNDQLRKVASDNEKTQFDKLVASAKRVIEQNNSEFENYMDELRRINSSILWRQDWFLIDMFKYFASSPYLFNNKARFAQLVKQGELAIQKDDMKQLDQVIDGFFAIKTGGGSTITDIDLVNIVKG